MGKDLAKDEGVAEYDPRTLGAVVESLVTKGDVSALNPEEKARFYVQMCTQLGLNPATQPLAVLKLNGKEIFYPTRGATDQLAAIHRLTREIIDGPRVVDLGGTKLVMCICRATHPNGRTETSVATVPLTDPANVLMKCETKGKRRATLSILGLGMLDESELDTIPASAKSEAPAINLGMLDTTQNEPAAPPPPTARELLDAALAESEAVSEVAQVWIDLRGRFEKGTPTAGSAWLACLLRVIEALGLADNKGAREQAKKLLLEAIKAIESNEPPPSGNHSTGEHEAAPATDAEAAAEASAIAAEGSTARAWIQKTLAGHHEAITHLVRSWLAHHTDFGAEHEAALLVFVEVARKNFGYGKQALERFVRDEAARQQKQAQAGRAARHLKLVRRAA